MAPTRSVTWAASSMARCRSPLASRGQQRGEQGLGPVVVGRPAGRERARRASRSTVVQVAGGRPGQRQRRGRRRVGLGVGGAGHAVQQVVRPLDLAGLEEGEGHADQGVALADGLHVQALDVDALEQGDGRVGVAEGHVAEHGDDLAGEALGLVGLLAQLQAPRDRPPGPRRCDRWPAGSGPAVPVACTCPPMSSACSMSADGGLGRGDGLVGPARPHPHRARSACAACPRPTCRPGGRSRAAAARPGPRRRRSRPGGT